MKDVAIIIPSLEPDNKLVELCSDLYSHGFMNVIIVNDGSSPEYNNIYTEACENNGYKLLRHYINMGKGRSLKTAFNYILNEMNFVNFVITVDSDGQHKINDIMACLEAAQDHCDDLTIGSREFRANNQKIPFRSRFGNILTKHMIRIFCGLSISDTQTGLRVIPRNLLKDYLSIKGERFEYEMNMLLESKERNIHINEVPIATIYIEGNATSHFNSVYDSARIYRMFGKYVFTAISSTMIDLVLFSLFIILFKKLSITYYIFISTLFARILSSFFNYYLNKNKVFKNKSKLTVSLTKYYLLAGLNVFLSAAGVRFLYSVLGWNETICKMIIDSILFIMNYIVQREWVFRHVK